MVYAAKPKILLKQNVVISGFVMMNINMYYFHTQQIAAVEIIAVILYVVITVWKNILDIGKIVRFAAIRSKRKCMFGMEPMNTILKS